MPEENADEKYNPQEDDIIDVNFPAHWSKRDSRVLLELWDEHGLRAEEIANVFWISKSTVYRLLNCFGRLPEENKHRSFSRGKLAGENLKEIPEKDGGDDAC